MNNTQIKAAIECMLFAAGEPVLISDLQRILSLTDLQLLPLLYEMEIAYQADERGLMLQVTEETVQLCTKPTYAAYIRQLLQPVQSKTISQAMIETLAVIAYRQPVTRAEIEAVRGVRCEYAINQLIKLNLVAAAGRKDVVGRPVLYATTDTFLRQFGIHSLNELPQLPLCNFDTDTD